jgi:hypothetical protein
MELDFSKKINDSSELKGLLAAEQHRAEISVLPDSEFAYIEAGGRIDGFNRTVPLTLRHFPILDEATINKSIASLITSRIPQGLKVEIFEKISLKAQKLGVVISESAMPPWLKEKDDKKSDDKKSDDKKSDDKKSDDKKSDDDKDKKKESKAGLPPWLEKNKKSDDKESDDKKSDDKKSDDKKSDDKKSDDKKSDDKKSDDKKESKGEDGKEGKSVKKTTAPADCPECY